MGKPYQLVVFDWEGTLGDTLGVYLNLINIHAQKMKLGNIDEKVARHYLMFGLGAALHKLFPQLSDEQCNHLLNDIQKASLVRAVDTYLLPKARWIVEKIHAANINLAIATNKGHQSLVKALQTTGLDQFFAVTRSASQVPAKPCPQMMEEILDSFAIAPSQALMIGDSVSDIEMAKSMAVDVIGVDFYNQIDHQKTLKASGAIEVFDDYDKVAQFLKLRECDL